MLRLGWFLALAVALLVAQAPLKRSLHGAEPVGIDATCVLCTKMLADVERDARDRAVQLITRSVRASFDPLKPLRLPLPRDQREGVAQETVDAHCTPDTTCTRFMTHPPFAARVGAAAGEYAPAPSDNPSEIHNSAPAAAAAGKADKDADPALDAAASATATAQVGKENLPLLAYDPNLTRHTLTQFLAHGDGVFRLEGAAAYLGVPESPCAAVCEHRLPWPHWVLSQAVPYVAHRYAMGALHDSTAAGRHKGSLAAAAHVAVVPVILLLATVALYLRATCYDRLDEACRVVAAEYQRRRCRGRGGRVFHNPRSSMHQAIAELHGKDAVVGKDIVGTEDGKEKDSPSK